MHFYWCDKRWPNLKRYRRVTSASIPSPSSENRWSYAFSSKNVRFGHSCLREEERIPAFENKWLRRLLRVPYWKHKNNDYVRIKFKGLVGWQESLLTTINRRKMAWSGQVTRHKSLCKAMLTVDASRDGNARADQTWKSGRTLQCRNYWETTPPQQIILGKLSVSATFWWPRWL